MTEIDKDMIRARMAELLKQVEKPRAFDQGLHNLLRSLGSEEQVVSAEQFIPGLGESYGVPVPALRIIAAELAKWDRSAGGNRQGVDLPFALLERLWHNGSREERVIVAKTLERLGKRKWERTLELAASFVDDIRNWEECDQLACFGLRYVVQRHPEPVLARCRDWVQDEDTWTRRFGVVVLTSLPKGKSGKTFRPSEREFAILDAVMDDEAEEVQKAVAWALREMCKRDPTAVDGYLRRYVRSTSPPTRRIIKEAMRKLPDEEQVALRMLLEEESDA